MIEYSDVLPGSEVLKSIEMLYNSAFPAVERRKFDNVKRLIELNNVPFKIVSVTDGGEFVGFLSFWQFDGFRYIEHFAIDKEKRGRGIGSEVLLHFIQESGKTPIILEVEIPESSADARRRVDFYMRHSFILWRLVKYIQPPYDGGSESIEMKLMTLQVNDKTKVEHFGNIIRREVYGVLK